MATAPDAKNGVNDYKKQLGNQTFPSVATFGANDNSSRETHDDDYQLMPGIQLDSVRTFSGLDRDIHVTPIIVDFRSLLLSKTGEEIIKGVS